MTIFSVAGVRGLKAADLSIHPFTFATTIHRGFVRARAEIRSMELGLNRLICFVVPASLGMMLCAATAHAGGNFGGRNAVGGVMIDAAGVVRSATVEDKQVLANLLRVKVDQPQGEMAEPAELRMVSLRGLQAAIAENKKTGRPIPEAIEFLAGLQRIEYVFVDEDKQDIVIAGPAEPWMLQQDGSVVGKISGGATLRLTDLAVALEVVEESRKEGISCSIEPTPEGRRRLQQLLRNVKIQPGQNPKMLEASMQQAFGPQMIRLTGIPNDSRYARILVAADFEMKRIAMALTKSGVEGLPSYLQMSKDSRHTSAQNPRWWMACNYDALSRSEDGLAWKLSGQGVKTLTEQDLVAKDGTVEGAGRTDKIAANWADLMTEHYTELSRSMPVFGDLRNLMDMSVVATLISQERLAQRVGLDLTLLIGEGGDDSPDDIGVPKAVEPQCSFIRGRSGWVVTASGGVDINAFEVVENQRTDAEAGQTRETALAAVTDRWWWDRR